MVNPGGIRVNTGTKVRSLLWNKLLTPTAEKSLVQLYILTFVPQTDSGRWGENPKVLVRTLVQELGKMYP